MKNEISWVYSNYLKEENYLYFQKLEELNIKLSEKNGWVFENLPSDLV